MGISFSKPKDSLIEEFIEANRDIVVSSIMAEMSGRIAKALASSLKLSEKAVEASETIAYEIACFLYYCSTLEKPKAKEVLQLALFQALPFLLKQFFSFTDPASKRMGLFLSFIQALTEYRHSPAKAVSYFAGEFIGEKAWGYDPKKTQLVFYMFNMLKGSEPKASL